MTTKVRSKPRAKPRARAKTDVPTGYRRWDAANYLQSEEDMAAYLEAAMEEAPDDSAFITAVLADIARARGIMQLANDTGITPATVSGYPMKGKGKIKTRPFDSAEFLDTPEAIAAYLTDAVASGSSAEFQDALNVVARARGMTRQQRR